MKLHLGSGGHYLDGWTNIDNSPFCEKDVDLNLDQPEIKLPFDDDVFDEARAIDFFEHIQNFIPLINEVWRVLKPEAELYLEVPRGGSEDYYKDPTHVRPFIAKTFRYLAEWNTPLYGIKKWKIKELRETTGGENENRVYARLKPIKDHEIR